MENIKDFAFDYFIMPMLLIVMLILAVAAICWLIAEYEDWKNITPGDCK